jgi:uncharacterized protein
MSRRVTFSNFFAVAFLMALASFARAGEAPAGKLTSLIYLTAAPGSELYTAAVGQAQILTRYAHLETNVQPTPGPTAMPRLIAAGEAQLGIGAAYSVWEPFEGVGNFDKPYPTLRAIQAGHDVMFAFITREDTGIKTIADLKGHKVTINYPAMRLPSSVGMYELQAYGLDPAKDVMVLKAENTSKGISDVAEGRSDAAAASIQGSKIQELAFKTKIRILPFDPEKMPFLSAKMPGLYPMLTPAGVPAVDQGIPVVNSPGVVWTTSVLPDDTAYLIIKTLIDKYEELVKAAAYPLDQFSADRAVIKLPIPYHDGVVRYYKEKGLWNAEMDRHQEELLKKANR